jgi:hypothetical protein
MKLLQELNQIEQDKQLDEAMDPMVQEFLARFLHEVAKNPEVAEGLAIGALFLLGKVFQFYGDVYYGAKEFFAKFKRIKEMKNPEEKYKELKKLSNELDKMVADVLKDKKIDRETRAKLKELQDEMARKVNNMAEFIDRYKDSGSYPGMSSSVGANVEKSIGKWTDEFNKLRARVQKTVEKSTTQKV